jgi:glutamine amidotransferase
MNVKPNIAILDFGINNLFSIKKALEKVGSNTIITSNKEEILDSDALILPGVGSYDRAMNSLRENNLVDTIHEFSKTNKYVLGICLGMQLLMDSSEEFGYNNGLGLIEGVCKKFDDSKLTVPHIMWNKIEIVKEKKIKNISPIDLPQNENQMYFVHSYYVEPKDKSTILTKTLYQNFEFCSAVQKEKIIGFQFHPEKSSFKGIQILKNFINLIKNDKK